MEAFKKHLLQHGNPIRTALERFGTLAKDPILFIIDEGNKLLGSLTDGDVRRGLLKGYSIDDPIDSIINNNPKFIRKGERDISRIIQYREDNFRVIPIVNEADNIVNVINFRETRSYLPIDAVIMAGGKGKRLRPLTNDVPKPLLKVGDKPILEHNIDRLRLFGIDDFWLSINYKGDQIKDYFKSGQEKNVHINYVNEKKLMGTIGSLSIIENFGHDYILVMNSDILTNLDYEHFFLEFLRNEADVSVLTIPYTVEVPYAVLETRQNAVLELKEKPSYTYYSNGGIYLLKRECLKYLPADTFCDAPDFITSLINNGLSVYSHSLAGYWLDIGSREDYIKANKDINHINF